MLSSAHNKPDHRRSTRVALETSIEISIEVEGERGSLPFKGVTVTVNMHGALIRTVKPLDIGSTVYLRLLHGEECAAKVVHRLPSNPLTYGIELIEPRNVWGISLPPADWTSKNETASPSTGIERTRGRLRRAYISPAIKRYDTLDTLPEKIRTVVQEILSEDRTLTVVVDEEHRYLSVSEEFALLLGYSGKEIVGKRVDDLTVQGTVDIDFAFHVSKRLGEAQGLWLFEGRYGKKLLCRYHARKSGGTYTAEIKPLFLAEAA